MLVKPPTTLKNEEEEPKGEILDFNNPSFKFIPKGIHTWRAQGIYIICKSCELEHAIYIGLDKRLVGIDEEGKPILVDRKDYEKNGFKYYAKKTNKNL